jgi:transcriptional regulator with XRE-family HTH domain
MSNDDVAIARIGGAIRSQRLAAGLSMRELATAAGMSQPFLSNLENGRAMPSVATLYRLASALGVGAHEFLPPDTDQVVVVRRGEGLSAAVDDAPGSARSTLVAGAPGHLIEAHVFDIEPGQPIGDWFEHEGEDFLVVTEGRLTVEFADGQLVELHAGDSVWHVSTLAHRWIAAADEGAHVILVNARPPVSTRASVHNGEGSPG